jgi:hypothetical protein
MIVHHLRNKKRKDNYTFTGLKLSGVKIIGFTSLKDDIVFIYFMTLSFSINTLRDESYSSNLFDYFGREKKILKSIYPWYTDYFGIVYKGYNIFGISIKKGRIISKFKPKIKTEPYINIHLHLFNYLCIIDLTSNYK